MLAFLSIPKTSFNVLFLDLCRVGKPNCAQVSLATFFDTELKNLEVVLSSLFHPLCAIYWYHQQQNKPEYDSPTTLLKTSPLLLRTCLFSFVIVSPEEIWLVHVSNFKFQLSMMVWNLEQGFSYFVSTLSIHGDVKLVSLWTLTLVFWHFPVHGRL